MTEHAEITVTGTPNPAVVILILESIAQYIEKKQGQSKDSKSKGA